MDKKLGQLVRTALDLDVPDRLVVVVLTTTNRPRLDMLLDQASRDCLLAFATCKENPVSAARQQLARCKVLVDLIRTRRAWLGGKRPDAQGSRDLFLPVRTNFGKLHLATRKAA